jgi:diphthine-ammonia ligase
VTVSALVSGGKDSIYSAYLADSQARTVDELVVLRPSDPESFLFHTPNLDLVALQAQAWGKRVRSVPIPGTGEEAERAALREALRGSHDWVVAGAIASAYQWSRLQRVCFELGRPLYTPLWGKEAVRVVEQEIAAGLDIRLVHLAAEPLGPEFAGRQLDLAALREIERLGRDVRAVHPAGEGGEFETLVVDAPFWDKRLVLDDVVTTSRGGVTSVQVKRAHLAPRHAEAGPPT